ncbi:hypothetical protein Q3G72_000854 [Acer saccharum]|nr:hypothetical protein Q3G72_000854 [Acer saccharum]
MGLRLILVWFVCWVWAGWQVCFFPLVCLRFGLVGGGCFAARGVLSIWCVCRGLMVLLWRWPVCLLVALAGVFVGGWGAFGCCGKWLVGYAEHRRRMRINHVLPQRWLMCCINYHAIVLLTLKNGRGPRSSLTEMSRRRVVASHKNRH